MILSMPEQTWLFLTTVCMGALIGLFYDIFRVFRKTAPHSGVAVQLEDLFFWIIVTALVFYFMLHRNYGEIRLHSMSGLAIGVVLYFATISQWVLKVAVSIVNFFKRVLITTLRIILLPFRLILSWLEPPIMAILRAIRKRLRGVGVYGKIKLRKSTRNWSIMRKKV